MGIRKFILPFTLVLLGTILLTPNVFAYFKGGVFWDRGIKTGTVKVSAWSSTGCGSVEEDHQDSQEYIDNFVPGNTASSITVLNNGSIDEWVRLTNVLEGAIFQSNTPVPIQIKYAIQIYQPNSQQPSLQTANESDSNGDLNSNCHTGSKYRGAGGNDKPFGQPLNRDYFTTSDKLPTTPFKLPVGYYAIVSYTWSLDTNAPRDLEAKSGTMTVQVNAEQIHNDDSATSPSYWNQ